MDMIDVSGVFACKILNVRSSLYHAHRTPLDLCLTTVVIRFFDNFSADNKRLDAAETPIQEEENNHLLLPFRVQLLLLLLYRNMLSFRMPLK